MEINVELVFKINEAELIRGDATLGSEREVTSSGGVEEGAGRARDQNQLAIERTISNTWRQLAEVR